MRSTTRLLHRSLLSTIRPTRLITSTRRPTLRSTPSSHRLLSSEAPTTNASPLPPPELPPSEDLQEIKYIETLRVVTEEEPEKRKKTTTRKVSVVADTSLPENLQILFDSTASPDVIDPFTIPFPISQHADALPPPEVFEEALQKLRVAFHPRSQHRATYKSPSGASVVEPTLALYCPIEGGDYVIDATVRELAKKTGAEVVLVDSVELAAGEYGHFGKAAQALQLPRNPLHFPSSSFPPPRQVEEEEESQEQDEENDGPTRMVLQFLRSRGESPPDSSTQTMVARKPTTPNKLKLFFDNLVNISSTPAPAETQPPKPRIIYIRDYPTLAATSSLWYPALLSAVRQRRQGPVSRTSQPISFPMTIVFGITPPINPFIPSPSSFPSGNIMSLLLNPRGPSPTPSSNKISTSDWVEDDKSNKAREKRLKDRLKKWERSESGLVDELPGLPSGSLEGEGSSGSSNGGIRQEIIVVPSSQGPRLLPLGNDQAKNNESFFRTSTIVPKERSLEDEKMCRTLRRTQINELTMHMALGAIGGVASSNPGSVGTVHQPSMWGDWEHRIETWDNVRRIADRALGSVVGGSPPEKATLEPTVIPWAAIENAWHTQHILRTTRKAWSKDSSERVGSAPSIDSETQRPERIVDELVERVKQDPDLDEHEQRLLGCIVDSGSMPTSFDQVHLPTHTIDSVRTIVSLPLLHPAAFQLGILKEHGMNGVILFGPPGTGKTLVVRALAKEAGCRMMAINPSDVMDMYVGEGEKLVRSVFSLARRLSPCVVFLDEIDALFGARMSSRESGGAFAHRGVITEFMQEMDGLRSSKDDRVIVIGATNRPYDLDDAVLRRLPRRLMVDLPGETEREAILKIHLRDETLSSDVDLTALAKRTENFSGSDLKHLCVSAALDAVKETVDVPWKKTTATIPLVSEDAADTTTADSTQPSAAVLESSEEETSSTDAVSEDQETPAHTRVISMRNIDKALKEITPSSSEALGSLSALRKWAEEFGEGGKKRQQVWGRGNFGFNERIKEEAIKAAPGV